MAAHAFPLDLGTELLNQSLFLWSLSRPKRGCGLRPWSTPDNGLLKAGLAGLVRCTGRASGCGEFSSLARLRRAASRLTLWVLRCLTATGPARPAATVRRPDLGPTSHGRLHAGLLRSSSHAGAAPHALQRAELETQRRLASGPAPRFGFELRLCGPGVFSNRGDSSQAGLDVWELDWSTEKMHYCCGLAKSEQFTGTAWRLQRNPSGSGWRRQVCALKDLLAKQRAPRGMQKPSTHGGLSIRSSPQHVLHVNFLVGTTTGTGCASFDCEGPESGWTELQTRPDM